MSEKRLREYLEDSPSKSSSSQIQKTPGEILEAAKKKNYKKERYVFLRCLICNSKFERLYFLRLHYQLVHPKERITYHCALCDKFNSTSAYLMHLHQRAQHAAFLKTRNIKFPSHPVKKKLSNEKFLCNFCSLGFVNLSSFQRHNRAFHPELDPTTGKIKPGNKNNSKAKSKLTVTRPWKV